MMKARRRYTSGRMDSSIWNNNEETLLNGYKGLKTQNRTNDGHMSNESDENRTEDIDSSIKNKQQNQSGLWIPNLSAVDFYVLIAAAALYCYINGLDGELLHDDIYAIKNNKDILPLTSVTNVFCHDFWGNPLKDPKSHKSYRPITTLTFRANYLWSGFEPYNYHVVNVCLHVLTSLLFTYVCQIVVFKDPHPAYLAGLIFAVHPIHTEAVTNIVGRAELLACLFFLLGFWYYAKCIQEQKKDNKGFPRTSSYYELTLTMVFGVLAMLSKEQGATMYGVFLIYDVFVACRKGLLRILYSSFKSHTCVPLVKRCAIVCLSGLLLLAFRIHMLHGSIPKFSNQDNPASHSPYVLTRLLSYCHLAACNVYLLICPIILSYDWHSIPLVESLWDVRNLATVAVFGTFGLLLRHMCKTTEREQRVLIIGLTFLILPFLPASNLLITVGFVIAERVLYIPSMGYCILLTHLVSKICKTHGGKYAKIVTALAIALITLYAARTITRNRVWQSRETLFRSGLETHPYNAKMHYNWANYMKDTGHKPEAISHYRQCLHLYPNHTSALNNLGTLLSEDHPDVAESLFNQAIRTNPLHSHAHYNLANLFVRRGDLKKGRLMYEKTIRLDPTYKDPYTSFAVLCEKTGDVRKAEELYKMVMTLNPEGHLECNNYAVFLTRQDKHQDALNQYNKCLEINPYYKTTLVNMARLLRYMEHTDGAESLYLRALQINKDPVTLQKLGALYYNTHRLESAKLVYEEAIALAEDNIGLQMQYAQILVQMNKPQGAINWLSRNVMRQHPKHVAVHRQVASIYSMQSNYSKALQYIDKALSLVPESDNEMKGHVLFDKGNIYRELKKNDSAIESYQRAVQLYPSFGSAHMNLAGMWHIQGNYRLAKQHYTIALRYDPQNKILLENIAKISRLEYNKTSDELNTSEMHEQLLLMKSPTRRL